MTREIKFRAFVAGEMQYVYSLDWGNEGLFKNEDCRVNMGKNGNFGVPMETANLMQYTGLKDKNGKEIYEGDIIEKSAYDNDHLIGAVQMINGRWCTNESFNYDALNFPLHVVEIIGNIHENPELLK